MIGLGLPVCLPVLGLGLCCGNPRLAYVRVRVACIFACVRVRVMLC